jgi:hypothetical protein
MAVGHLSWVVVGEFSLMAWREAFFWWHARWAGGFFMGFMKGKKWGGGYSMGSRMSS